MLTSEHAIVVFEAGRAVPDRLTRRAHRHYVEYAERAMAIYCDGVGRQRRQLHRAVAELLADEPDCPVRRVAAFCKLLDEKGDYHEDKRGQAAKLRLRVFAAAAGRHPLVQRPDALFESGEMDVKQAIGEELGMSWDAIDVALYADVLAYQRLEAFAGYGDAAALLARYNVAQLQACLYRAQSMIVWASDDFKTIVRYAKLARLLHEIHREAPGRYRLTFTGPATVLRRTRRYGVNFARFLPALLACRRWRMTAAIATPWKTVATLVITDGDGFTSHLPAPEAFDSKLEEAFARKFGPERDGWRMSREGEILHVGQTTFVPDFAFRHEDGTEALLEIVGFWTPEYLAEKRRTLTRFAGRGILLAVAEEFLREDVPLGDNVVAYKTALNVKPVLAALERFRESARPAN